MTKKHLLGAVAALTIAAPGAALAQSGYVDFGYTSSETEFFGLEDEADAWTLGGAVALGSDGLGFQFDGLLSKGESDGGGDVDSYNFGGHMFVRDPSSYLFGGFMNLGNVESGGDESDYWTIGAEGQLYLSQVTLDGALSLSEADDADAELTALDFGLTYFVNDNFTLGANAGFGEVEAGGGGDTDVNTLGFGGEFQFAALPVSIFAGYQHSELDDIDIETDTLGIGVRYNFGGTLRDRNRTGASLPRGGGFGRYAGVL